MANKISNLSFLVMAAMLLMVPAGCKEGSKTIAEALETGQCTDRDGDGFGKNCVDPDGNLAPDCDDADPNVHTIAQGYIDEDQDGIGGREPVAICAGRPLTGESEITGDCDDRNADAFTEVTGYLDQDGDGYTAGTPVVQCTDGSLPGGLLASASASADCDDDDNAIHPGATEVLGDLLDNDCSGGDLFPTDSDGIFVSTAGSDSNPGTRAAPVKTLTTGMVKLAAAGKKNLFVAGGTYPESVTPGQNGVPILTLAIYGGYSNDFASRDVSGAPTIIKPTDGTDRPVDTTSAVNLTLVGLDLMQTPVNGTQYYAYSQGNLMLYSVNIRGYSDQRSGTKHGVYVNGGALFMSRSTVSGIFSIDSNVYGVYGRTAKVEIERSTFQNNGHELGSVVYQIYHNANGSDTEKVQQGLILDRVTIEPGRTFSSSVYGIRAYARRVTITNSTITGIDEPGGSGYAAYLADDANCNTCGGLVDIRDSSFTGADPNRGASGGARGLYLGYWQNVLLEDSTFVAGLSGGGTSYGVEAYYNRYVTATGNMFSAGKKIASSARGVYVYDTDGHLDFYNNTFDTGSLTGTGYGLDVNTGDALVEITHNTASLGTWANVNNDTSWSAYGIRIQNISSMSPGITIANNSIRGIDAWTGAGLPYSADYYGIDLSNNNTTTVTQGNGIVLGVSGESYGIYSSSQGTWTGTIAGNNIRTAGGSEIYGIYSDDDYDMTISGNRITHDGPEDYVYGIGVNGGGRQSVLGNTIVVEDGDGVYAYGLVEWGADNTTLFRNNTVQIGDAYRAEGIRTSCGYARFETNTITVGRNGNYAYGVYHNCGNATFRGNDIEVDGTTNGSHTYGFYVRNGGPTLIDNEIVAGSIQNASASSFGLYVDVNDDFWVEGNTIDGGQSENGSSYGVYLYSEDGDDSVFVNNRIYGGESRSSHSYGFYVQNTNGGDLVLVNNFIHGGRSGFDGYSGRTWGVYFNDDNINVYLAANSIYGGDGNYSSSTQGAVGLRLVGSNYAFVATNNIVHAGTNALNEPLAVVDNSQTWGNMGTVDFYNNLLYGEGTSRLYYDGTFISDIAQINACSGDACDNASGNISGNPQYLNPTALDLHIQANSIAVNAGGDIDTTPLGIGVPQAGRDIDGTVRPAGLADIGADER